jgi:hypothetical protein
MSEDEGGHVCYSTDGAGHWWRRTSFSHGGIEPCGTTTYSRAPMASRPHGTGFCPGGYGAGLGWPLER